MNPGTLDLILGIFVTMLQGAHAAMLPLGIGILAAAAAIELYWGLTLAAMDGYMNYNRLMGRVIELVVAFSVLLFLMQSSMDWSQRGLLTFMQFGFAATGAAGMLTTAFQQPSTVWDMAFLLAKPLKDFIGTPLDMAGYYVAWVLIVLTFLATAVYILLAQVEFNLAAASAPALLPWGALSHTGMFAWGLARWLAGCLVRIFIVCMLVAGMIIAFARFGGLAASSQGNVLFESAWVLVGLSFLFAALVWTLPSIAAGAIIGGGGGLGVGHLLATGMVGVSAVQQGTNVVRGVSAMVRGR